MISLDSIEWARAGGLTLSSDEIDWLIKEVKKTRKKLKKTSGQLKKMQEIIDKI